MYAPHKFRSQQRMVTGDNRYDKETLLVRRLLAQSPLRTIDRISSVDPLIRAPRRMKEYLPQMLQGLSAADQNRQEQHVYHSDDNVGPGGVHFPSQPDGVR